MLEAQQSQKRCMTLLRADTNKQRDNEPKRKREREKITRKYLLEINLTHWILFAAASDARIPYLALPSIHIPFPDDIVVDAEENVCECG